MTASREELHRPAEVVFRPAKEGDFDFLYGLHVRTIKAYVEQTWGWDETFQRDRFRANFSPALDQLVSLSGKDIGMLSLEDRAADVFLRRIEIDPQHQNRGIGTTIIRKVIADAAQEGKPVFLHVLKVNPAVSLYQRLGFAIVEETPTRYDMRTGV